MKCNTMTKSEKDGAALRVRIPHDRGDPRIKSHSYRRSILMLGLAVGVGLADGSTRDYPQGFMDIRNDRRAFPKKLFPPIWADTEWIFGYLAEGGEHFLLSVQSA